jgi:hypothetical protein
MHKFALDRPVSPSQRAEGMTGLAHIIAVLCRAVGHVGGE